MALRKWVLLNKAYKNKFDYELSLSLRRQFYFTDEKEVTIDDVIPT